MDEQFGNEEQVDQTQDDGDNDGSGVVEKVENVEQPAEDGAPDSNLQTEQPDQPVPAEPQPAEPVESPAPASDGN